MVTQCRHHPKFIGLAQTLNVYTLWAMHIGLMAKLRARLSGGQTQNISCQGVDRAGGCGHGLCVDWGGSKTGKILIKGSRWQSKGPKLLISWKCRKVGVTGWGAGRLGD